jgi:hypothetical protein
MALLRGWACSYRSSTVDSSISARASLPSTAWRALQAKVYRLGGRGRASET